MLPKREKRCRLILETLGGRQMTASEITEELVASGQIPYFNRNYVAPRLTEMKQMGILETVGRRKATRSDATEAVWARAQQVKEADRQALAAEPGLRAVCTDCGLRGAAGVGLVDTSSKKEEKDHE